MSSRPAPVPRGFYEQPLLRVTRRLLGHRLVRELSSGERVAGRVVEVEAYGGSIDPSAHSWRGPTARCATMFGPVGHAYAYFSYGSHWCINVVAGSRSHACAILLRAVEVDAGLDRARRHRCAASRGARLGARLRAGEADLQLADGPGKLTAAFALGPEFDGHDLCVRGGLWLEAGVPARRVAWTPRVGLGDVASKSWRWRAVDVDSELTRVGAHTSPRPDPGWTRACRARHVHPDSGH